jgi:hypothetical protein
MKRNKCVTRIAREQDYRKAASFSLGDQILPAQLIPAVGLRPLFEKIVCVNEVRNPLVLFGLKREGLSELFTKICGEECPYPGAAALGDRDD